MRIKDCNNIMDFRRIARRRLPAPVFHYMDGGADDEWTLARNTDAFNDYELLPSQLS
ncbi:MAG: alpha-hydroxy-acid oxidizing protein, partial [Gammaproteobacteria bacterium]|nr:alpha-hydroxy-acid oxidizing protein [Gammaproteobacteria bacterium]